MSAHAAPSGLQLCQRSDWPATTGDPDQEAPVARSLWPTTASPATVGTASATGEVYSQSLRLSPRSRIARSTPGPQATFSMLPSRELIVSSLSPPLKLSTPARPVSVSLPVPPSSESGPLPVVTVSVPPFMKAVTGFVTDGSTINESLSVLVLNVSAPVTSAMAQLRVLVANVHGPGTVEYRPAEVVSWTRSTPPETVTVNPLLPPVGPV